MKSLSPLLILVFVLVVVAVSSVGAATVAAFNAGSIDVEVREHAGTHIDVRVPAVLVSVAAPFVPSRVFEEAIPEIRPYWPAARALVDGIGDLPDAVFVEVIDRDERVIVKKVGDRIVVDARSSDQEVHVSVPLGTVRAFARRLDRAVGG